jgi:hypothetical protein
MAWLMAIGAEQTKVRQPFIKEHRSRKGLVLFVVVLLLIPRCAAEAYIGKLWGDVELGRHGVKAVVGLLRSTTR